MESTTKGEPTPFATLAMATRKDFSVIERQASKLFERLVIGKKFQSGDMLVALAMLYHSILQALEAQQPGLMGTTHDFMKRVFDEMAGIEPAPQAEEHDEQPTG